MPREAALRDRVLRTLLDVNVVGGRRLSRARQHTLRHLGPDSSLYALHRSTDVTFAWVHEIVSELRAKGWLADDPPLRVTEPAAVYGWWAGQRKPPEVSAVQVQDPALMAHRLSVERRIPTAVTTYYAENFYQGHLFPRRMDTYVPAHRVVEARNWLVHAGAQLGGLNFRLLAIDDAFFTEAVPGAPGPMQLQFAPLPQVIVDLIQEGAAAKEAADLLIQRYYHAPRKTRSSL